MKKVVFPFLGILMIGLSGCLDKGGDNFDSYSNVPAVVVLNDSPPFLPALYTSFGYFLAPELQNVFFDKLDENDAIVTHLSINTKHQSYSGYTVVSDMQWSKITKVSPYPTTGGESSTGEFVTPIEDMDIFDLIVYDQYKGILFLGFIHTASSDQTFEYEMTYDPTETDKLDVYVRAKKNIPGTSSNEKVVNVYAFDLYYYLNYFANKVSEKKISFNIKYQTEENGDLIYKDCKRNPITIEFE